MRNTKILLLSPPKNVAKEHQIVVQLFEAGLQCFHLRKPDFSDIEYAQYLAEIPMQYWNRIVLHHHYHLAEQLSLGGVHLTERSRQNLDAIALEKKIKNYQDNHLSVSAAIHDLEDLQMLGQWCDYVLISPVFDSISKADYKANPDLEVTFYAGKVKSKLFALGGMTTDNANLAFEKGFEGVAVLGYVWEEVENAISRYNKLKNWISNRSMLPRLAIQDIRPFVLTFAGHDPSAGAGLNADLKTFEQYEVYGLSVCTALTVQTDVSFDKTNWVEQSLILDQALALSKRFSIKAIKIGLIQDLEILKVITTQLFAELPIIFDPILKASAGFEFHNAFELEKLYSYLKHLTLITPNREEILQLVPNSTAEKAAEFLSQHCAVLLKGGHHEERLGEDELWQNGRKIATFKAQQIAKSGKHGSGCVLSAAIAANLAKGEKLIDACRLAKEYTERFLHSNDGLLGYHK